MNHIGMEQTNKKPEKRERIMRSIIATNISHIPRRATHYDRVSRLASERARARTGLNANGMELLYVELWKEKHDTLNKKKECFFLLWHAAALSSSSMAKLLGSPMQGCLSTRTEYAGSQRQDEATERGGKWQPHQPKK